MGSLKYILYGAGQMGLSALNFFGEENVYCFCDTYLYGTEFEGKQVISLRELKKIHKQYRVVVTPCNAKVTTEIAVSLSGNDIDFVMYDDEVRLVKAYKATREYSQGIKNNEKCIYSDIEKEILEKYSVVEFSYIDVSRIGEMMSLLILAVNNEYGEENTKNVFIPRFILNGEEMLFPEDKYANSFLYKKIGEKLEVLSKRNVSFWCKFLEENWLRCKLMDRYSHQNMMYYQRVSMYKDRSFRKKYLRWKEEELSQGNKELHSMGVKKPYICFFGRTQKYLNTIFGRNTIHPNDYIRNQPIDNYELMCSKLSEQGIMSVRMGYMVDEAVHWDNVVDYASDYRNEFMDLYTIAEAKFFVSCPSGIQMIATMYDVPSVVVDFPICISVNDIGHWLSRDRDLIIFQKIRDRNGNYLSLKEMLTFEEVIPNHYDRMAYFLNNGYVFEKNTPKDIWLVTKEMIDRVDNNVIYTEDDVLLQNKYFSIIESFIVRRKNRLVWFANARVGRDFLRQNRWLLD